MVVDHLFTSEGHHEDGDNHEGGDDGHFLVHGRTFRIALGRVMSSSLLSAFLSIGRSSGRDVSLPQLSPTHASANSHASSLDCRSMTSCSSSMRASSIAWRVS